jgi:prolyl-tRNA editing enzyme YbaK/EbsC (Cys-tRNA(Pro) deacylase)
VSDPAIDPGARALAALEALGEPYELIEVDPALADTAAFCEHYGYPLEISGNTILVASKRGGPRFCACVVLATTRLDVNHAVRPLLGTRRASFASAEETAELTGMVIGGVTPFGLPPGLAVYIDERVMALDAVIVGGGDRSTKLQVSPQALLRLPDAKVVAGLARAVE